jgi:hypothetical protein
MAKEVISRLDEAQESRTLSSQESELCKSLARTIAQQRSRLLFLGEGDANTKFFHLQACHRARKNRIDSLWVDGSEVVSDTAMAQALYDHYNSILGTSFGRTRRVNLTAIGLPSMELGDLEVLFTEDKVRSVVRNLPNDKAPGPDSFTGLFYKVAWDIIKSDVLNALHAFWAQDGRSFSHLNGAYMVLLKKKAQPAEIKDCRPVSLIHSFGKLVTKCMANRHAPRLDALVCRNQSAIIKGRRIQDNFRTVWLSCRVLHAQRSRCLLLKIDIAKAFDTVSWTVLLKILQHLGFGLRWRNWISVILGSASTRILLNGQPGRRICHARGLRQGDPLSPMLFVLVMEVINYIVRWLDGQQLLTQLGSVAIRQRVSLYADDMILLVVPNENDLTWSRRHWRFLASPPDYLPTLIRVSPLL